MSSKGEGEGGTADLAHGDTLVRNHDGSFGSKLLRFDGILEVGRGKRRREGKEEEEKGE